MEVENNGRKTNEQEKENRRLVCRRNVQLLLKQQVH